MRKKLSVSELAKATGITERQIHYLLAGKRNPSKATAQKLARATGISEVAWMFPEIKNNPYYKNPTPSTTTQGQAKADR